MSQDSTPMFETIRLEMTGSVATLTLNRPQRLNAAPPAMFVEIGAALKQLPALGARALLITGEGRAFCSGADLQGRSTDTTASRGAQTYKSLSESYSPTMVALSKLSVPVIAAVNGVAAGIGCSLALAADFTLAARSAYFLEAFVNIGLVPDGGATWMLARQVGKARATEMMMLGDRDSGCVEPTLFMWRTIPGATLAVLPNSGHCINLEEPEVFNRLLLDFIDRVEGVGSEST